mmetsp:Transcript_37157/g.85292  ORF Transcript_37157/g.85292 Transcript_37157/m.85292 type:complete len:81 (-) Transcript_37157:41-283(-)
MLPPEMLTLPDVMCMAPPSRVDDEFAITQLSSNFKFPAFAQIAPPSAAVECKMLQPRDISNVLAARKIAPPSDDWPSATE